ncbi:MAG: hypothetical protein ACYDAC_09410 [Candidatus Dormibacteria bacterium]
MPASKRRLAAARAAEAARGAHSGVPTAAEVTPAGAPAPARAGGGGAPAPAAAGARPRPPRVPTDPAYLPWPRTALMALLGMVFILQAVVGVGQHLLFHRNRLIWIDLFFPNSILLLGGTVVLAPLLKRLLGLPRHLRWLESLSLGAVYALIVTLLTLPLIHAPTYPANLKNPTADDFMNGLTNRDVPGLLIAGTFGILFAAQVFPGLNRLITAPGRRAKQRLDERTAGKGRPLGGRGSGRAPRSPRSAAPKAAAKPRR